MRHYAREHERDQRRIDQLQAAKTSYLVGMKAIEACWNLVSPGFFCCLKSPARESLQRFS